MKLSKILLSIILCFLLIYSVGCVSTEIEQNISSPKIENGTRIDELRVHYIDVSQGDSTFIEFPDGQSMLVDAGENDYGSVVANYIRKLGYSKISYVIGTHPHSDHIGGLEEIIKSFEIGGIYMPKVSSNTKTFEGLLTAISDKGLKITTAKKGVKIIDKENISVEILSPVREEYSGLNNYSVVFMLEFYNNKFLFTADAETFVEEEITGDISCDVIKVGHHGSSTSSSSDFVKRTKAKYAVISCGKDNKYGHPHDEILDRWLSIGAKVCRTDLNGTIIIESDGNNIKLADNVVTQQGVTSNNSITEQTPEITYILNYSTKKIHLPSCSSVEKMKEENRVESFEEIEELLGEGYTKCGSCKPE